MENAHTLADRYIQSWNETDPQRRRALLEALYTDGATYTDPMATLEGREAIDATIQAVQNMFPGQRFSLHGDVDAHHDVLRFRWHLAQPASPEPTAIGFDVAVLKGGRIAQICGFLDKAPMPA
ncbi:MAG TPA: nuclear transport factor 2 family protein [Steroidobacteraceae bacterium]|jgi:hypothetical protein|nr:nuclear transport factor 2 family protein [Steroidobacteraceae bacterium]